MPVPYTFSDKSGNIPLQELDDNFSSVSNYVATAGTVTASAQPNIRSVGTLTGLTVVGTVTAAGITGTSLGITGNITGGNLNTGGIVRSNGVAVNGNLTVSTTIIAQGNVTGQYILGNGYYLTGITASGTNYSDSNVAAYLPTYTGNLTAGNVTITGTYRGNGAGITNVPGSSITGTVVNASYAATAGTVTATSLPNLSTIGTLNSLTVNGGISAGSVTSAGNISGAYILGDGSKLTNLPSSGNSNYGNSNVAAYLPIYAGQLNDVTINNGKYYGNGAGLTNLTGSAVIGPVPTATYAAQAATVTTASQPAITSVGTLSFLNVNGNISIAGSGKYLGDGSGLTGISGPIFMSYLSSSQSITNGTIPIIFNSTVVNTNAYYNSNNGRFQPMVPGYYQVNASVYPSQGTGTSYGAFFIGLIKNTQAMSQGNGVAVYPGWGQPGTSSLSAIVYLNGSTDYIYCVIVGSGVSGTWSLLATQGAYFQAAWVHA